MGGGGHWYCKRQFFSISLEIYKGVPQNFFGLVDHYPQFHWNYGYCAKYESVRLLFSFFSEFSIYWNWMSEILIQLIFNRYTHIRTCRIDDLSSWWKRLDIARRKRMGSLRISSWIVYGPYQSCSKESIVLHHTRGTYHWGLHWQ